MAKGKNVKGKNPKGKDATAKAVKGKTAKTTKTQVNPMETDLPIFENDNMTIMVEDGELLIRCVLSPRESGSGKSIVYASTGGMLSASRPVDGCSDAFIKAGGYCSLVFGLSHPKPAKE